MGHASINGDKYTRSQYFRQRRAENRKSLAKKRKRLLLKEEKGDGDLQRPAADDRKERQIQSNVTVSARVRMESTNILLKKHINKILAPEALLSQLRSQTRVILRLQYLQVSFYSKCSLNAKGVLTTLASLKMEKE